MHDSRSVQPVSVARDSRTVADQLNLGAPHPATAPPTGPVRPADPSRAAPQQRDWTEPAPPAKSDIAQDPRAQRYGPMPPPRNPYHPDKCQSRPEQPHARQQPRQERGMLSARERPSSAPPQPTSVDPLLFSGATPAQRRPPVPIRAPSANNPSLPVNRPDSRPPSAQYDPRSVRAEPSRAQAPVSASRGPAAGPRPPTSNYDRQRSGSEPTRPGPYGPARPTPGNPISLPIGDPPAELAVTLLPHQEEGVQWMIEREQSEAKGGILADDMGLGKTAQAIALMLATRNSVPKGKPKTTLVVAPLALLEQWRMEVEEKATGALSVLVHHGPKRPTSGRELEQYDVVLTTYQVVVSELPPGAKDKSKGKDATTDLPVPEGVAKALYQATYHRIILDEAHTIKSRETQSALGCRRLRATMRFCLTGTPIQNSIDELASPFEFFADLFKRDIVAVMGFMPDLAIQRLRVLLSMYVLRRTKALLSILPRKTIVHEVLELTPAERSFYQQVQSRVRQAVREDGGSTQGFTFYWKLLLRMRQAVNHPMLFDGSFELAGSDDDLNATTDGGDLGGIADLFRGLRFDDKARDQTPAPASRHKRVETEISSTEQERVVQVDFRPVPQFSRGGGRRRDWESTKIARAMHILHSSHRDDSALKTPKTIVFSQFTSMLDIMERAFNYDGMLFERFDGKMTRPQKENALARRIILLDLWWNPQIESQAFDSVHRLGQEHAVIVHKLTCKETIEDRILALQDRKRQVASDVLAPHEADERDDSGQESGTADTVSITRRRKKRGGQVRLTLDEVLRLFQ
ncbi:hypothetical protein AMAG_07063 [Allomyces macrogynus ATCC 38327]|uniref:Helicase ATP-binding domain-containing protein n=1 Tax=Allomyces macrogynus (strain ATCC 38327) TaxID=578462 RepID=A0A0L0SFP9_ALLM3|nr:hypothetical protein AMAG_07063 [Allomyces macrogynus ATCC 38327]|eukprot:KNE61326.1 hypothetical protein AMAG_07063 [Allomyces macrogynus ATCC 38327]